MNACAYYLILRAQYDDAQEIAERMRETADAYQLTFSSKCRRAEHTELPI